MENKKSKIIRISIPILLLILGAFLGGFFTLWLAPNIKAVYISNVIIDYRGANNTSAKWEYHIQPERQYIWNSPKETWAFFNMDIVNVEDNLNLSDYKGVSFYIKGNIEKQSIEFNIFTHNFSQDNKRNKIYQYWNKGNLIITTNWRREEILFSDLSITPWIKKHYPETSEKPNLEKIYAFGFAIKTYEPIINEIWIDELYLIQKNGSEILISDFNTLNVSINGKEGLWHAGWGHL